MSRGASHLTLLGNYDKGLSGWPSLTSHGPNLYFNIDAIDEPIVSYDVLSETFGTPRIYTKSVSGGNHSFIVAARSPDIFYGHCACGYASSANEFNLATDTSISLISTATLGDEINVRYGYFDSDILVMGGRSYAADDTNRLLYINTTTNLLEATLDILSGATVRDIAQVDGQLYALVDGSLIVVGTNGRAEQSIVLDTNLTPRGLAAVGKKLYVVAGTGVNESGIYEVTLP